MGPNLSAGGAQRQWSILLPGLRRHGIDARVIALGDGGAFVGPLQAAGVPAEVLHMRHRADLLSAARSRLLRTFVPDVVVSRGVSGLYVGQMLAYWRGAIHIFNEHRQVGMPLSRRRELMTKLVSRRIDQVIAVTGDQAGAWLARGYPQDRIVIVANGVEAPRSSDSRLAIRRELGLADRAIVALLVAALRPEKRVADFIRAISLARQQRPELVGLIAGDGPDRVAVQSAAAGVEGIRMLGHRDDIARLLTAADMFVLTSEYEAVPMAILEAMAAGLPVLCTEVGSIPEVIRTGETGLLVPARDPEAIARGLVELSGDPQLRASLGAAAAQAHRERWSAETMIDGYAEALERACRR